MNGEQLEVKENHIVTFLDKSGYQNDVIMAVYVNHFLGFLIYYAKC